MKITNKKSCSILLFTFLLFILFSINIKAASFSGGNGTASNPYIITTVGQLESMTGSSHYKLGDDIYLDRYWNPIGTTSATAFKGTLDGAGFTIYNLKTSPGVSNKGLFGYTKDATIKNLNIENDSSSLIEGKLHVGAIVGYGTGSLTIDNCHVDANVIGSYIVGGLVGSTRNANITNCSFIGNVTTTERTGYAGGIAGEVATKTTSNLISKCYVEADISSGQYVGGIVGNTRSTISECVYVGEITATSQKSGGIAGETHSDIRDCSVDAIINGYSFSGGIAGNVGSSKVVIERCYVLGEIISNPIGGIARTTSSYPATIRYCFALQDTLDKIGGDANFGRIGTATNSTYVRNFALEDMTLINRGEEIEVIGYPDNIHGEDISASDAQNDAIYRSVGWDFNNIWTYNDEISYYPVLKFYAERYANQY